MRDRVVVRWEKGKRIINNKQQGRGGGGGEIGGKGKKKCEGYCPGPGLENSEKGEVAGANFDLGAKIKEKKVQRKKPYPGGLWTTSRQCKQKGK